MIPLRDNNPFRQTPYMTIAIIAVNIGVFIIQFLAGGRGSENLIVRFGAIPFEITHFQDVSNYPVTPIPNFLTLFTAMFMHGGLLHILSNMLYLWIFGDNVEYLMGHFRFLLFYLLSGLIAALAHILVEPNSTIPMIGASGAISGVLGAYFIKFPRAKVLVVIIFFFIQTAYIPAVFVLGFWFLMQLSSGFFSIAAREMGGIAWFAHIGGFIAGMILVSFFQKRRVTAW